MNKNENINDEKKSEVDEKIRNWTINKSNKGLKPSKYNKIYPIASLVIACAIIMAIVLPNKSTAPINDNLEQIEETLPKVEKFEDLYGRLRVLSKNVSTRNYYNDLIVEDKISEIQGISESMKSTNSAETQEYSKTNIQVEGVDEADIVKTDGNYIYYLSNNKLTITDVTDNENIVALDSIENENDDFYPREIFLRNNKIVIIGIKEENSKDYYRTDSIYYSPYSSYTIAKVYNIENKKQPKLERTVGVEGNYLSSRMIGDNIYLISNKYINAYLCREHKLEELSEEEFLPKYMDTIVSEEIKQVGYDCIYYIPECKNTTYLNIASFNIINNNDASIESYLGAGEDIYASNDNLYITQNNFNNHGSKYDISTDIYKFKLNNANCIFKKVGSVPGTVLNQFSMDEKDGYFRIATTNNNSWNNENSTNNLYILNENLEIVGKVEDLARGEKIYSVRFIGNRAYMVTFVETDPLFVIDLEEPTNPKVLGELKIPGYSKYLHPYDDTHLIGFGEDTKVVNYGYGESVLTDGMKMALFDVTDPEEPKELYSVKIGERGTSSELLNNHKALLFSKEKNIIAFPISITKDDYEVTFQGAIVYGLSLDKGFELKGKISNQEDELSKYYYKNRVERIIYIKDTLYTLSQDLIKGTDINTMEITDKLKIKSY